MRYRGAIATLLLLSGCSGPLVNVAPFPPEEYSEGGQVSGSACGLLFLGMFPMQVNDRAERAYDRALKSARATSLTDTAVNESWYFTPIGPAVCTGVEGVAIIRSAGSMPKPAAPRAEFREVPKYER